MQKSLSDTWRRCTQTDQQKDIHTDQNDLLYLVGNKGGSWSVHDCERKLGYLFVSLFSNQRIYPGWEKNYSNNPTY